jgi:hypothetical protein
MIHAGEFDAFEVAWRDFLGAIEKSWVKVERLCQSTSGFPQWQRRFKTLRLADPLLRYVYHARHVDQHTVAEIVALTPGQSVITMSQPGTLYIAELVVEGGLIKSYRGSQPLRQTITPARANLLPVTNRGAKYDVPTEHLGAALPDSSPVAVGMAALKFYAAYLTEAQAHFAGGGRSW